MAMSQILRSQINQMINRTLRTMSHVITLSKRVIIPMEMMVAIPMHQTVVTRHLAEERATQTLRMMSHVATLSRRVTIPAGETTSRKDTIQAGTRDTGSE